MTHLTLRSTCTADCRRNGEGYVGAEVRSEPAPLVHGSFTSLDQQLVDFWLFPDVQTQQLVCDEIDDVGHGFQDTLVTKFCSCLHRASPRPCRCHWKLCSAQRRGQKFRSLLARQRSRRRPSRIHALRYHVWMTRSSDLWIDGNTGHDFFLSHLWSARQLSRSRSVTGVHVQG